MQRIFNFITKANQILIFFAALAILGVISFIIFQENRRHDHPAEVKIAQTPEDEKNVVIDDVQHIAYAGDIHIFGIFKRIIGKPPRLAGQQLHMSRYGESDDSYGQLVNVVFTRDGHKIRTLLSSDGMIVSHRINETYEKCPLNAFLFKCIVEDTDNNHILNEKDRTDLYIVSRDLAKPDTIVKGITSYEVLSENIVLIKTNSGDVPSFTEINVATLEKREIPWK